MRKLSENKMLFGNWRVLGATGLITVGVVILVLILCEEGPVTREKRSVARALDGLRTLSKTMHDHSGIDNPLDDWMEKVFGKWKMLIMSLFVSIAVFTAILVTCGCCCVPCIRSLMVRLITSTIEGKAPRHT